MTDLARLTPAATGAAPRAAPRDVVFTFFGASWSWAVWRGMIMPEDRFAQALLGSDAVRRLLVCNPYRSVAGRALAAAGRRPDAPFPERESAALYEPLRLRRSDPVDVDRSVRRYEDRVRAAARRRGLERPAIITTNPLLAGLGRFDWAGPVTYYAWDDWLASVPHRRWWPAIERSFAQVRELERRVVSVSDAAERRIAPTGPHAVIENGVSCEEWLAPPQPPAWFRALPGVRAVYAGSLDSRVDVRQVAQVAQALEGGSVVLVGSVMDEPHFAPLRALDNVHFIAWLPRAEITGVIAAADVCLVPHARNELTEAMSPLKVFEYLAAGRPVASVDLPPIARIDASRLVLAPAGGDLVPAVRRALELGPAPDDERICFLRRNGWDVRFEQLLDLALAP